jgi:hypothetical protein
VVSSSSPSKTGESSAAANLSAVLQALWTATNQKPGANQVSDWIRAQWKSQSSEPQRRRSIRRRLPPSPFTVALLAGAAEPCNGTFSHPGLFFLSSFVSFFLRFIRSS